MPINIRYTIESCLLMTHSPCWYRTTIDTSNAIKSDYVWPDFKQMNTNAKAMMIDACDILDPDWVAQLNAMGLTDISTILFYSAANYANDRAHTDMIGPPSDPIYPAYAFNLIVGPDTKDMVWFDPDALRSEYKEIPYSNKGVDAVYGDWPVDLSNEIDRARIGDCLTLVRIDVPHWVSSSDQPRLCLSLRFFTSDLASATWDDALHLFKDILVKR